MSYIHVQREIVACACSWGSPRFRDSVGVSKRGTRGWEAERGHLAGAAMNPARLHVQRGPTNTSCFLAGFRAQ